MANEIDIAGTMAKPIDNWQDRVTRLAKPEHFRVSIETLGPLSAELTQEERDRLGYKITLVALWAKNMAAGMVKGTIKYNTDSYPIEQWMAHMIGEGVDQSNYQILLFDAFQRFSELYVRESDRLIQDRHPK